MKFFDGMDERARGLWVDMGAAQRRLRFFQARNCDGLALEAAQEIARLWCALNAPTSEDIDEATDVWLRDERMHDVLA